MEELDLKELLQIFWKKKLVITIITLICLVGGLLYSYIYKKPLYKSSTRIALVQKYQGNEEKTNLSTTYNLKSELIPTYVEFIKSNIVLSEVVKGLDIEVVNEQSLKSSIKVEAIKDTDIIEITVENADSKIAAQITNKIVEISVQKLEEIYNIKDVYILDKVEAQENPYNINHAKDVAIFVFIGLIISAVIVLIITMFGSNNVKG